jgi:hypothetical protein
VTLLRALGVALAGGVVLLLAVYGTGEPGMREVVRWTARSSLLLFCAALATEGRAVSLPGWPGRTQLLRGLALSHFVHAVAVGVLAAQLDGRNLLERSAPVTVLGGALAYLFIFWGVLRPDSRTTSVGLFWIWVVFMVSYGGRALKQPIPFGFAVALLSGAMLARLSSLLARAPSPARESSPARQRS